MSPNMRSSRATPSHALQGPRPTPLAISPSSGKIMKRNDKAPRHYPRPVVIYLRSPKIIHVRPEEFMSLVQELTGNSTTCSNHERGVAQKWKTSTTSTRNVESQNKFQGDEITEVPTRISSNSGFDDREFSSGYFLDIQMS